jgi:hypothetical protein
MNGACPYLILAAMLATALLFFALFHGRTK